MTVIKVLTLRHTELFDQYSCISKFTTCLYRCIVSESLLSIYLDEIVVRFLIFSKDHSGVYLL
jgi:hypothetical protein